MARLTDAQVRSAREQALRSVRRAQRKLDTKIEVMERRLDRSIENKERITFPLLKSVIDDFQSLVSLVRELETKISSATIVFNVTSR